MIKYKVLTVCVVHSKELSVISVEKMLVSPFSKSAVMVVSLLQSINIYNDTMILLQRHDKKFGFQLLSH